MAFSVDQVRDHYEGLSFGSFCYGDKRAGFYPLFDEFVASIGPADRVCDVGCGAGFFLDEFVRRGVAEDHLLGIDLAPSHVRQARARGHHVVPGNVLALDLPADSIDRTFCAGVIHHTPDPARALRDLARVTRPGGLIYLAVYNAWHPYFWLVHKATSPLRMLHWRGWTRVSKAGYRAWKVIVQPISRLGLGRTLDESTCRALFMDQVLTPYAHLFTQRTIAHDADAAGLEVVRTAYALRALMIIALLRVRPR